MRIDDSESLSAPDVIDEQIGDEFGFPNPGLTDYIGMPESILIIYPDRDADRSVIADPDYVHIRFYIFGEYLPICLYLVRESRYSDGECEFFRGDLEETCFTLWSLREMIEGGDFFRAQDIFFYRSMPLEDVIKRRDIPMYPEIELVEWIIFEDEEIIKDRFYSRSRSALVA